MMSAPSDDDAAASIGPAGMINDKNPGDSNPASSSKVYDTRDKESIKSSDSDSTSDKETESSHQDVAMVSATSEIALSVTDSAGSVIDLNASRGSESKDGTLEKHETDNSQPQTETPINKAALQQPSLMAVQSPARRHSAVSRTHTLCSATYLGRREVDAPSSRTEISRNISQLQPEPLHRIDGAEVLLCIPRLPVGKILLMEAQSHRFLCAFPIQKIIFCCGSAETTECIGFTTPLKQEALNSLARENPKASRQSSMDSVASSTAPAKPLASSSPSSSSSAEDATKEKYFCHLFQLPDEGKADFALKSLGQAFRRHIEGIETQMKTDSDGLAYQFDVTLGIAELDAKGNYVTCPVAKDEVFKLRAADHRQVTVTVTQTSQQQIIIERAFALLIGAGRDVDHAELSPLSIVSGTEQHESKSYTVVGGWDSPDILQCETPKDNHLAFSVAIDIVLAGLEAPIRFVVEAKVRVHKATERFWMVSKKEIGPSCFKVHLVTEKDKETGAVSYAVSEITAHEPTPKETYLSKINKLVRTVRQDWKGSEDDLLAGSKEDLTEADADDVVEEEEHIYSGSGTIERNVSTSNLEAWSQVLLKWDQTPRRHLRELVRRGVPDKLRHQVWKRLAPKPKETLGDTYKYLLNQTSPTEQVIVWDLTRTFPGHEFFQDADGDGQRLLYNVNKAYSVYDEEIGYCQGLSFISAVLLLHMPEEEAFELFVQLMFDYGVRELFRLGFENLQLKFYQLTRLLEDHLPDLAAYFKEQGIESHMYASQWFLTLYAAKFSLNTVFHVMDLFMLEGHDVLFQVALALLKLSKKELLQLPFEDILTYFRMTLPRLYSAESNCQTLIATAMKYRSALKKLKKYEKDYYEQKAKEEEEQDPLNRLTTENAQLVADNIRLESETDVLARELVTNKIDMQRQIDQFESENHDLTQQVAQLRNAMEKIIKENATEKSQLAEEAAQVKDMYRNAIQESEEERARLLGDIEKVKQEYESEKKLLLKEKSEISEQLKVHQARAALSQERPDTDIVDLQKLQHETELALAQVKLKLVESECENQTLSQQLKSALLANQEFEESLKKKGSLGGWFKGK